MKIADQLNKTFMFLYETKEHFVFPSAFEKKVDIGTSNPIMLLEKIHNIGFADKEKNHQQSLGNTQAIYNYWLNAAGKIFVDDLPNEFKDKPYSYYSKRIENEKKLKEEREGIDYKLKQVTLANINFNKRITTGSIVVAILAIIIPIIMHTIDSAKITKTETTLPQLPEILRSKEQNEKANQRMYQEIIDSLKNISTNVSNIKQ